MSDGSIPPVWRLRIDGQDLLSHSWRRFEYEAAGKISNGAVFEHSSAHVPFLTQVGQVAGGGNAYPTICQHIIPPPNKTDHIVDYAVSLPFFRRRFYVRLLFGKERRNLRRLAQEGQLNLPKASIGLAITIWLFVSMAAFGSAVSIYLIKSTLGIDLIDGPSIFHSIFYN